MKKFLTRELIFPLILLMLLFAVTQLPGCTTLNLPKPQTAAQQLAAGYATVSSLRSLAASALQNNLIKVDDAKFVLAQTDLARIFLDSARAQLDSDPKNSFDKIQATVKILEQVQQYLAVKGVK